MHESLMTCTKAVDRRTPLYSTVTVAGRDWRYEHRRRVSAGSASPLQRKSGVNVQDRVLMYAQTLPPKMAPPTLVVVVTVRAGPVVVSRTQLVFPS